MIVLLQLSISINAFSEHIVTNKKMPFLLQISFFDPGGYFIMRLLALKRDLCISALTGK